jgi:hypothetical protein
MRISKRNGTLLCASGDVLTSTMCPRLRARTRRAQPYASASAGRAATRRAAHPPLTRTSCEPCSPTVPGQTGSASSYEQPSTILARNSIRCSRRCGSHKWEPTCSAALRRSATRSDSFRRSRTPSSTNRLTAGAGKSAVVCIAPSIACLLPTDGSGSGSQRIQPSPNPTRPTQKAHARYRALSSTQADGDRRLAPTMGGHVGEPDEP